MSDQFGQAEVDVTTKDDDDLMLFSVTTVIDALEKGGLVYWAAERTAEAAIDNLATWQAMLTDRGRAEAVKWLRDARFRPTGTLSDAALGTVVHNLCETYALTGVYPTREYAEELVAKAAQGFRVDIEAETRLAGIMLKRFDEWCQRFTPSYQATEVTVYNKTYGYAGQADAFLTIDGVRFIGDYKGLDRNTPIATPTGWTTMGALQVGDQVFGTDGQPVTVTAKSEVHLNRCYRVTFDDTTSIVCDDEHLWPAVSRYDSARLNYAPTGPLRTDAMAARVRHPITKQRDLIIPLANPLQLPPADVPIDPYVYGCWLGDGTCRGGSITGADDELFDHIAARGYKVGDPIGNRTDRCRSRTIFGLNTQLRVAGLRGHREVPQAYLRGSVDQRLDLLRGLMDTDGSWNETRQQAVFCTVVKATAESVYELVASLGERPLINTAQAHGFGKDVTAYQVTWRPRLNVPFALSRKADKVQLSQGRSWRRLIVSVEPTLTVPTQCITVDAFDGCYLAGTQMVATHNTSRKPFDGRGKPRKPYPEQNALQLAAYRFAEFAAVWRPRRYESYRRRYYLLGADERAMAVPVPTVDAGLVLKITSESCQAYPMKIDESVFQAFLFVAETWRWVNEQSKTVMGEPLTEPTEVGE